MGKKIKRSKTGAPAVDPNLEDVGEDRAMEFDIDEETKEIIIVHHYRRKWGDEFDSDTEHIYTLSEVKDLVSILIRLMDEVQRMMVAERDALLIHKSTPNLIEGNPLQGPKNIEGV
jgi:hypothetical protein